MSIMILRPRRMLLRATSFLCGKEVYKISPIRGKQHHSA